jgi:L-serine dehydratase
MLKKIDQEMNIWSIIQVFYPIKGQELFSNSDEMISVSKKYGNSLGYAGLQYESNLLGLKEDQARDEMNNRLKIMIDSVEQGLEDKNVSMPITNPSAGKILNAEKNNELVIGGIHTRAAARAMATMHIDNSMGVVCAAPTGGSAGVLPGILATLIKENGVDNYKSVDMLFAAAAIGIMIRKRATFSAELAGCQVEIGASGAMSAAAVVEFAGGTTQNACDAAAIALQNTMGSVCDPVKGGCEIPCHTRNALAVSNAFICADLILGGYQNLIPLDETIDAMLEVGKAMPSELRCTAKGGIAVTPTALSLK